MDTSKYFRLPFTDFASALGLFVAVIVFVAIARMLPGVKRFV